MRLIDADALEYHKQLECMGNGQYENVKVVYECDIDNAPTIDAEPVVHGEWRKDYRKTVNGVDFLVLSCSECDNADPQMNYYNYCPNCGAKMERKEP